MLVEAGFACGPYGFTIGGELNLCGKSDYPSVKCYFSLIDPCTRKLGHPASLHTSCGEVVKFAYEKCRRLSG